MHVTWDLIMPQMVTDRRGFNTRYSQQWYKYRNCKSVGLIEKVKVTLVQSLRLCTGRTAHRGSRCLALLFHDHALEGGEGSASRPGRSLSPEKTRYPLYRRLGGPKGRSGQVRKISPPPRFDPRNAQPVASRYKNRVTITFLLIKNVAVRPKFRFDLDKY